MILRINTLSIRLVLNILENPFIIDFQEIQGQDNTTEFVAVAAGGHNQL